MTEEAEKEDKCYELGKMFYEGRMSGPAVVEAIVEGLAVMGGDGHGMWSVRPKDSGPAIGSLSFVTKQCAWSFWVGLGMPKAVITMSVDPGKETMAVLACEEIEADDDTGDMPGRPVGRGLRIIRGGRS